MMDVKFNQFEEPMAGKGKTPMENAYLAVVDAKRKAGVNWCDIPHFRLWVDDEFDRLMAIEKAAGEMYKALEKIAVRSPNAEPEPKDGYWGNEDDCEDHGRQCEAWVSGQTARTALAEFDKATKEGK